MLRHDNQQDSLVNIQISIARAAADHNCPSLKMLYDDIMEEFGCKPSRHLVDYFADIAKIPSDAVADYFKTTCTQKEHAVQQESPPNPAILLARSVAVGNNPTVLHFRQRFIDRFKEPPPEEMTTYFLEQVNRKDANNCPLKIEDNRTAFAEYMAADGKTTVFTFRLKFQQKYGSMPPTELIEYFLKKMVSADSPRNNEEYRSRHHFARKAATVFSTVLQFRRKYEKVYNELPPAELIEVFIENLPVGDCH